MDDLKALAARRWFGYGRWDAPYWFIGMEPGGTDDHASYEVWMQLGGTELIDCRAHHLGTNFAKWHGGHRPPTQPTWRRLIQLLLGYEGKRAGSDAVSIYQRDSWGAQKGDTALLEVSALHAKNLVTSVNRNEYLDERTAILKKRLETNRPKFVVFYGLGYKNIYEKITNARFGANGYAWCGSTLCALLPGPTARNIPTKMKSPEWWVMKGCDMRAAVEEGSRSRPLQSPAIRPPGSDVEQAPQLGGRAMGGRGSRARSRMDDAIDPLPSDVIQLLSQENPKRAGSKSYLRFNCYRDGMTVAQYIDAVRIALGNVEAEKCLRDLQWDSDPKRNFIRIKRNGRPIAIRRTASMSYDRRRYCP